MKGLVIQYLPVAGLSHKEDCAWRKPQGMLVVWWRAEHNMRNLKKNQRKLWYALYQGKIPILDENGDKTGDYTTGYSPPVQFEASLSPGNGSAQREVFGIGIDLTRSISTTDMSLPITETSLVWHETKPGLLEDGSADPDTADYEVAAPPAVGLNTIVIALKARAKNSQ